jgi:hypothetical protein
MDFEKEIKRLRRLNMKMYFTMSNIIQILNNKETDQLLKLNMKSIDKDILFNDDYEIYERINNLEEELKKLNNKLKYELFNNVNYLMKKQIEKEVKEDTKFFEYSDCDNSDSDSCGCGKEPHKQCEEIEEYIRNITQINDTDSE